MTGTDTDIGKTLVSACLAVAWRAAYWKPVQTGLAADPGDTATVAELAGLSPERVLRPAYAFQAPLSPHAAAAAEGTTIALERIQCPQTTGPVVVEGAGGVLVPLNESALMADLIKRLGLPAIVVARTSLGTINHTLLSLEALRARDIRIAGVILNGEENPGNRHAIETFGHVRVLAELPRLPRVDRPSIAALAARMPDVATVSA
ncbi:MAG TPA: dethiobiotin synthase [Alphaproteobacteria bacterium]